MTDSVIQVENVSKRYTLDGSKGGARYHTLREGMMNTLRAPLRRLRRSSDDRPDATTDSNEFWALRDVSFTIVPGEVVGIIGRNGAGKSTLLKILSRITEPTAGKITLKGRVASLLEVGTGFHPELTGRENIYLNGAILGMHRHEIKAKFDEIVEFAEVAKFLDTPVKRYSSGMYVRLAFAVAAHLEPEILIVDEVLAVGDAEFQQKCLGKMESVSKREGRTVLFVSHQLGMITSLCTRVILLEEGRTATIGPPSDVVRAYYARGHGSPAAADFTRSQRPPGDDTIRLEKCHVENAAGKLSPDYDLSDPVSIVIQFRVLRERRFVMGFPYPQINVYSSQGSLVFSCMAPAAQLGNFEPGSYVARCLIPGDFLNNDTYYLGIGMASCESSVTVHFYENNVLSFQVGERISETLYTRRNGFSGPIEGVIRPQLPWQVERLGTPATAGTVPA